MLFQKKYEQELIKLDEKIQKTRDQLENIAPQYDGQRQREEQAAAQWVYK